ncbi:MAG: hypothetical protein AMXMBFR34_40570 [Myxococcaceae bacterium]
MRLLLFAAAGVVLLQACGGLSSQLCGAVGEPCCEAQACNSGGRCGAANTCEACGGASQRCCLAGPACAGQANCLGDVCLPCGGKGQSCCEGDVCDGALTCTAGSCAEATSCTNPCDVGTSRCASGGIETCVAAGACPAWRTTVSQCPGGTSCLVTGDVADCVEACPGACTPDAVLCTVEGLKRCVVSGGGCPSLVTEPDDPGRPQCVTGGVVGTELVWESPTPLNTPLAAVAGDLAGSYWVLDALGNVVHNALGSWEYEVRAAPGKRALALTSCNLGSRLVAGGEGGTIYRRGFGSWTEENVGAAVTLSAVSCNSTSTYAAGSDGKLYLKGSGAWSSVSTGVLGPVNALGFLFSQQRMFLVGNGGQIVNCNLAAMPVTCASESSATTANLLAAWGDTFTDTVYAAGTEGAFLERIAGSWQPIVPMDGPVTATLRAVHGVYDSGNSRTNVVAVGDDGAYVARPVLSFFKNVVAPEPLTGVMVIDADNVFVSSFAGKLWYSDQLSPPPAVPFTTRGGARPTTKTLRGVASFGPGRLLAVGDDGTRLKRESGAWLPDAVGVPTTQALRAVAARSNAEAYAVGGAGTVLARRYGSWSDDAPGVTASALYAVALDAEKAWAVGDDGAWLEKTLAGGQWASLGQAASTQPLRGLAVRADAAGKAAEVVAVGGGCTVLSKVGPAVTVVPVAGCPPGTRLLAAAFTPAGELYVGGEGGVVFHRTTSGFQREYLAAGTLEAVNAFVTQGSTVWALCDSGELFRRTGSTWAAYAVDVTRDALAAGVSDAQEGVFFVGARGLVWRKP